MQYVVQKCIKTGMLERVMSGDHLECEHAHRVKIRGCSGWFAVEQFRRDVIQRSGGFVCLPGDGSQAEIQHLELVILDQDITRLQIAVDDVVPVQVGQGLKQLYQK